MLHTSGRRHAFCVHVAAVGTFVYSAPEMLIGNDSGVKADIYSFGVVLWEIITGAVAKRGRLHDPKVGMRTSSGCVQSCKLCDFRLRYSAFSASHCPRLLSLLPTACALHDDC